MNVTDYYHRIALEARRLADEYADDAAEVYDSRESGKLAEEVKEDAEQAAAHGVFREDLGGLWTISTFGVEDAELMARIVMLSNGTFRPKVENERPQTALASAAELTIRNDIEEGAFDIINRRLQKRGIIDKRRP